MSKILDQLAVDNSLQVEAQINKLENIRENLLKDTNSMDAKKMMDARDSVGEIDNLIHSLRFPTDVSGGI